MTRTRRLLAFVLEVLLLQVSILGGSMACASGVVRPPAMEHATHAVALHGGAHHDGGTPAPKHEHAATHCLLAGGCAVVAVTSPALLVATVTVVHSVADVADEHLRRSARPAPEPPPPRG